MQSWHSRWAASVPKLGVWEEGQRANVTSSQGESELRCTTAATLMCGGTAGMSRKDLLSKQHSKLARTDMQDRQLQGRTLSWLPAAWQYLHPQGHTCRTIYHTDAIIYHNTSGAAVSYDPLRLLMLAPCPCWCFASKSQS
jgi:hypothetical protein